MHVLVTGAFGFVGSAVVRALLGDGHRVVALTRRADAGWSGSGDVEVVRADLLDHRTLGAAVDGVGAVCHLAALTRVRESFEMPDEYAAVNSAGTENLLGALIERGLTVPVVHASSAVVYGAPEAQPIGEDCPPDPTSPYAATKLAADAAIRDAAEAGRVAGVSLRIFNVSGSVAGHGDPDETRIIPKAVAVAAGRHPELGVNGDGSAIRDFVHVADVADAFALAVRSAQVGRFAAYNLGATPASVADIIEATQRITGRTIPVRHNPPAPEAPDLRADTARARAELGWKPVRSALDEIIADVWAVESAG